MSAMDKAAQAATLLAAATSPFATTRHYLYPPPIELARQRLKSAYIETVGDDVNGADRRDEIRGEAERLGLGWPL